MGDRSTHVVFSTGCSAYFDWQSLGLAYSHAHVRQPGRLTRLLSSCLDESVRARTLALPLMHTHEHPDYGSPAVNGVGDAYAQYNKPAGLLHWLEQQDAADAADAATSGRHASAHAHKGGPRERADFILLLESDMLLRRPIDCAELGVRPWRAAPRPLSLYSATLAC
jgi:hypothetical protein